MFTKFLYLVLEGDSAKVIQYLSHSGCMEDEQTTAVQYAAAMGFLDILKYFVESCHWDPHGDEEKPLRLAALSGQLDVVQYLVESCNCNIYVNDEQALRYAAEQGQLDIVKYLL